MDPSNVTLAIPCYNVESTLPEVLESVDSMDPAPAEILCIDDGSDDRTTEIIDDHARAQLIEHDRNRGIGAALNTALSHTETSHLAKIDADIVVSPNWLELMFTEMERTGASIVQGSFTEDVTTLADRWREAHPSPSFSKSPKWNLPLNGANILVKTDALRQVSGWDEQYRRAFDDIDVMERLIAAGHGVYYTPRVQSKHIRTDTLMEVLALAWAYSNKPYAGGPPTSVFDMPSRLKAHTSRAVKGLIHDLWNGRFHIAWVTLLQLIVHFKWDIDHIRGSSNTHTHEPTTSDPSRGKKQPHSD